MNYKKQMVESLLEAFELMKYGTEPPESKAEQFVIWMAQVSAALKNPNTINEHNDWDEAKSRVLFVPDESSFEVQAEMMKALLLGILDKIAHPELFVDQSRINELRNSNSDKFDLVKLIRLCEELNLAFANECYFSVAALTRAIIDHVPPIFGFGNFSQVVSQYSGSRSFKASTEHLLGSLKNVADGHLHTQARSKETLPNKAQVLFSSDLDVLLAEIVRVLK